MNYQTKSILLIAFNSFIIGFNKNFIYYKMDDNLNTLKENGINFIINNNKKITKLNSLNLEKLEEANNLNNENELNTKFLNRKREMIFIIIKKRYKPFLQKQNNKFNKKYFYRIHNRNYKDNILSKIQISYWNFLISFINEIIKKIIFEECYAAKNLDKICNMKKFLLNKIDYIFKTNIKKENINFAKSINIKDIISPSVEFCRKYHIKNRNLTIMANIDLINNTILTKILNSQYLSLFHYYYKSERIINLKEGDFQMILELDKNILLFDDLIAKYKSDEKYISNIQKFVKLNFLNNNK